jgi:tetratricopeptide (TPR) repeat protein
MTTNHGHGPRAMPPLASPERMIDLMLARSMKQAIPLLLAVLIVRSAFAADNPFEAGLAALKEGNFDRAISLFTEDIRLHPRNGAAYDNRGFAYLQKGDLDQAITDFTVPIRMRPDYLTRTAIARTLTKRKAIIQGLLRTIPAQSS